MRLPDIVHGQEHQGSIRFTPDIPEQVELSKRIDQFLRAAGEAAIVPTIRSRSLKDFRVDQPNGRATLSAEYSHENEGRFSAEVHASHKPSGIESHYSLFADRAHWLRVISARSRKSEPAFIDHDEMVQDMLEYVRPDGRTAELLDRVPTADNIVQAVVGDLNPSAHYRAGSDHFRSVLPTVDVEGTYASARHIELIDSRVNRNVTRQLSITALTNIGIGPVDVIQKLIYEARYGRHGEIKQDSVRLVHTSSDGLTPIALTKLAETSDIAYRPTDILHAALDELSRDTFVDGRAA